MEYLAIIFSSIFLGNILLQSLVGFPLYDKKTKLNDILIQGLKVIVVSLLSAVVLFPISKYLLVPEDWTFLTPILGILIVMNVNILVNLISRKLKINTETDDEFKMFVPINAVIIVTSLIMVSNSNYLLAILEVLGLGLGYVLITLLIFTIKDRLVLPGIPKAFKGLPLILITIGFIGMIFMGLAGIL